MKKYRIVKYTQERVRITKDGKPKTIIENCYEVQKRFLGFLWWYNFENIDACTTGIYSTFEEAQAAIQNEISKPFKTVVQEYD